jgi:6-phosphofructokinase 1
MNIAVLGPASHPSPLKRRVNAPERVPLQSFVRWMGGPPMASSLNLQVPARNSSSIRQNLMPGFLPGGGFWPRLNDVIRSLFFEMHHAHNLETVPGIRRDIRSGTWGQYGAARYDWKFCA